ncbi:MAG: hypothetical protein LPK80_00235 [Bacteroidota bacterium]|nr:hypothetical protein [Bacteroidota bacterium]
MMDKEIYPQNPETLRWLRNLNWIAGGVALIYAAFSIWIDGWNFSLVLALQIAINSLLIGIFSKRFGPILRIDEDGIDHRKTLFHRFKRVEFRDIRAVDIHLFEVILTLEKGRTLAISLESLTDEPLRDAKALFSEIKRNLEGDPDFSPLFKVPA